MKQFIYMDTDCINSIIAQSNKGLIESIKIEKEKSIRRGGLFKHGFGVNGKAEGSVLLFAKAEASFNSSTGIESSNNKQTAAKEIFDKTLHDAAFDMAYEAISPEIVEDDNIEYGTGCYVELSRCFDFLDFEYLGSLFTENGIIDYIKKAESEKNTKQVDERIAKLNREQKREHAKEINGIQEKVKEMTEKQYDDIENILSTLGKILPYKRLLYSMDGFMIPVEDRYFRVDPNSIGFMYGGYMKCVGMITNIITKEDVRNKGISFASLRNVINSCLIKLIETDSKSLRIISPLAIYYEIA